MKPSRPCRALPVERSPTPMPEPVLQDLGPRIDPARRERIELIARVLVGYVAEDPFGPLPLPPLMDRVRNALDACETGRVASDAVGTDGFIESRARHAR